MNLLKKYFAVLTALFVFIIFLFTLAPSVLQIDTGELAAVQATLGIAHPTGYPLFTITGYIFSLIPLPFSTIYQLNLLAAIWCSIGIGIFTYTAKYLLDNTTNLKTTTGVKTKSEFKKTRKQKEEKSPIPVIAIPEGKKYFAAVSGALILAFSSTYWFQSTSVEVYSLHILIINLVILLLLKSYFSTDTTVKFFNLWMIFAVVLALSFSNHMTTLLILPGTAYLYFSREKFSKQSLKNLGLMILLFFVLLILLYSYLPIRASQNPMLNWGNPIDFERILRHISGKQYQTWIFSSTESAKRQFAYFINNLPSEFSISLLISAAGLIASFRYSKKIALFFVITFISTVLYSINYDINDIDAYFVLAYISLAFFAVYGALKLLTFLKSDKHSYSIPALLLAAFIAVQAYTNFKEADQSNTHTFEDYTKALMGSVDENAIIFSYQWDFFLSASYYYQFVENYRRDIAIVDKELLRRSWYYNQLNTTYPGLLNGLKGEIKQFLEALKPFERSERYDAALLENLFRRIMTGLAETNEHRSFYIGPEVHDFEIQKGEFAIPAGYTLVPDLFLFKIVKGNDYVPAGDPDYNIRFPETRNSYIDYIADFSGKMLVRRAMYEMQYDKIERARVYIKKLRSDFPEFPIPEGLTRVLN